MKKVLAAAMAALALLFGAAPATANADPSDYLRQVQKELSYNTAVADGDAR